MLQPFQCILHCEFLSRRGARFLLAASGSKILSFDAATGQLKSTWSALKEDEVGATRERPAKRLKKSESQQSSRSSSAEIVIQDIRESRSRRKDQPVAEPNIPRLIKTADSRHIVAVTAEDKCVRVFRYADDGILSHFSSR